jgi:hypothetical protein
MRQRGRRSAEALAISRIDGKPPRLTAPAGLNAKERALFEQLVNAADPQHFRRTDIPVLIGFVQASLLSRKLGRDSDATRTMASLATRLRLTPASRTDPKTIARQRLPAAIGPWRKEPCEDSDDDEKVLQ